MISYTVLYINIIKHNFSKNFGHIKPTKDVYIAYKAYISTFYRQIILKNSLSSAYITRKTVFYSTADWESITR